MMPLPYSAAERAAGLANGPPVRYLAGNADLLPVVLDDGAELLPALPEAGRPAALPVPVYTIERRQPTVAATVEGSVWVPALQALFAGLSAGICAGLLAWALGWSWRVPVVVLALGLALGWAWRQRFSDSLLLRVETFTGLDVNGDGRIGPATAAHAYTVAQPATARATAATAQRVATASAAQAELLEFVRRCYRSGCAETAHGVKATGPDRAKYVEARETLFALGVAAWKNPNRPKGGWRMVVSESEALAIVAEHVL